jgi:fatty acid desaturase
LPLASASGERVTYFRVLKNNQSNMTHQELIRKVEWKDLISLSVKETLIENSLTIPWFIISITLAYFGYYLLALPFSAFFFLTGLRQVHNGFHNSLGTNHFLTWLTLFVNSILMLVSIHAVKFNHIRHHKVTWQLGNQHYRKNLVVELLAVALFIFMAVDFLIYHISIMLVGEFLMAFFAVWTVHHDTHENPELARTQRVRWKNKLTFSMFYHLEHHLFPAVPTIKLPELAKRIDKDLPEMEKKQTF